jgi:hypothetical protein
MLCQLPVSQEANTHHVPYALKVLVLCGDGQLVFASYRELVGIIEVEVVSGVCPSQLEITGLAQGKNSKLRQHVRRKPIKYLRPLLAEQQHADRMEREVGNPRRAFLALQKRFALLASSLAEQDFQKDVSVHQVVHRSSLRWCCNSTAVNRRFKSAKPPPQSNLKRRFVERADFVGVVFSKNSMNVSTCFCATTGKVSYLAINLSLLIANHATCNRGALQSGNWPFRPNGLLTAALA